MKNLTPNKNRRGHYKDFEKRPTVFIYMKIRIADKEFTYLKTRKLEINAYYNLNKGGVNTIDEEYSTSQ